MASYSKSTIPEVVAAKFFSLDKITGYNMFTTFEREDLSQRELYFKISSSLQITHYSCANSQFKFSGLYAIFKNDTCYYVGQSQNLASRLSQHLSGKYESADRVMVLLAANQMKNDFYQLNKQDRKILLEDNERYLINLLKPIENLITPINSVELDDSIKFESFFDCYMGEDEPQSPKGVYFDAFISIDNRNISISDTSFVDFAHVEAAGWYTSQVIYDATNASSKYLLEVYPYAKG